MNDSENIRFTDSQIVAIAETLGHTTEGLKGTEIEHLLTSWDSFVAGPKMVQSMLWPYREWISSGPSQEIPSCDSRARSLTAEA